ncbi:MAG: hypothetical protein IJS74_00130 [Clostridia bacterium]|nr:hypothetical protein [Clostridia bacterium]
MSTSKRIVVIICLLFAFVLLFFVTCALIMFLAPGTEIFGVRYVSALVGNYEKNVTLESFTGDVYIETENVPITIEFDDHYSSSFSFCQNFTGFTTTKISSAGINYGISDNDLKIKTTEFVKFIYAVESYDTFHLTLKLPAYAFRSGTRSIFINSNGSPVKTVGSSVLKEFNVKTSDGVSVDGSLKANDKLVFNLGKSVTIDEHLTGNNLDITTSGNSYVNIKTAIDGDIKVNGKGGDIKFVSCNNLYVETTSGAIRSFDDESGNVNFKVDVKTSSGEVKLGNLNTLDLLDENKTNIKTKGGKVSVKSARCMTITTDSGMVNVDEANELVVSSRIGFITVKKVSGLLDINVQNGGITAGIDGSLNKVKIKTNTGAVKLANTSGAVDVKSEYNTIEFTNGTSSDINLYAGRNLTASKLQGSVYAYSNGNINLKFDHISSNVSIETGSKTNNVNIDAKCTHVDHVSYVLRSTKGEKAKVYAGDSMIAEGSSLSNVQSGQYVINVKTFYGKINLYLSA